MRECSDAMAALDDEVVTLTRYEALRLFTALQWLFGFHAGATNGGDVHDCIVSACRPIADAVNGVIRQSNASGIEAAAAGETSTQIEGSTEGESPTAEGGDAQGEAHG